MRYNKEAKPSVPRSRYEEQWSTQDYRDNEPEFKQMAVEMKECLDHEHGSVVMARWLWLEKQKAVKLTAVNGIFEPMVRQNYAMMSAKYDRFTEWLYFQEKKDPTYKAMVDKAIRVGKSKIGKSIPTPNGDVQTMEEVAKTEIYDDKKHTFNNMEI